MWRNGSTSQELETPIRTTNVGSCALSQSLPTMSKIAMPPKPGHIIISTDILFAGRECAQLLLQALEKAEPPYRTRWENSLGRFMIWAGNIELFAWPRWNWVSLSQRHRESRHSFDHAEKAEKSTGISHCPGFSSRLTHAHKSLCATFFFQGIGLFKQGRQPRGKFLVRDTRCRTPSFQRDTASFEGSQSHHRFSLSIP